MQIQAMTRLCISTVRPAAPRQAWLRFAVAAIALLSCAATHAQLPVQQLTVAFTNSFPNASVDTLKMPNNAITAVNPLLTNGTSQRPDFANLYTALVWVTNPATNTLDVIYADAEQRTIWRLPGPSYTNPVPIFTWSSKVPGPPCPVGLAADPNANVYVISALCVWGRASVWVLPINAAGGYGAPLLIDNTFTDPGTGKRVATFALTEVQVAGSGSPLWSAGDLLVLVADLFSTRVIDYSQAQIQGVLASPHTPLQGPFSTVVTQAQFSTQALTVGKIKIPPVPVGMDMEQNPNTNTPDVTLLLSTADGRILDFDSATNAFTTPYAVNLGLGLTRLKVGTFQKNPYVFVGQLPGRILQFSAPASGSNTLATLVASVSTGVNNPAGLAVTYSASTVAGKCINTPGGCPITPQLALEFTGSGATACTPGQASPCIPPTAPIVVDSCTFIDTRVQFAGQCPVDSTLDLGAKCSNMPHVILPTNICGAWGATGEGSIGASIVASKIGASTVNKHINNTFTSFLLNPSLVLPGSNPGCGDQHGPIAVWAPLPGVESPTPEHALTDEGMLVPTFSDVTIACTPDPPPKGGGGHASVLLQGTVNAPLTAGYIAGDDSQPGEFGNLQTAFTDITTGSAPTSPPPPPIGSQIVDTNPPTITPAIQGFITNSLNYFNQGVAVTAAGGSALPYYNCALNTLYAGVQYVNSLATHSPSDFIGEPQVAPPYDQNPSGTLLARLDHLYYDVYIYGGIATNDGQSPPPLTTDALNLPASSVPACPTITGFTIVNGNGASPTFDGTGFDLVQGTQYYLTWTTTPATTPVTQCTVTTTDGLFTNTTEPANSAFSDGSSPVSFIDNTVNNATYQTATLTCGTATSSFQYLIAATQPQISGFTVVDSTDSAPPQDAAGVFSLNQTAQYYLVWTTSGVTQCTLTTTDGLFTNASEPVNSVFSDGSSPVSFVDDTTNIQIAQTATLTCGNAASSFNYHIFGE